mgnify:CR=1 FL=1
MTNTTAGELLLPGFAAEKPPACTFAVIACALVDRHLKPQPPKNARDRYDPCEEDEPHVAKWSVYSLMEDGETLSRWVADFGDRGLAEAFKAFLGAWQGWPGTEQLERRTPS